MSRKSVELTNQRFGRLVALKKVPPPNNVKNKTKSYWLCDRYDMESEEYGIGYDINGNQFLFDKEDFDKIKDYCWHICTYAVSEIEKGKTVYLHKLILNSVDDVDHINGNTLDNRKFNLREATHQQNMMNQKLHKNNTSGVSGVTFNERSQCWVARIGYKMKRIYLGSFTNYEDAVNARREAEKKYFGEWNRQN